MRLAVWPLAPARALGAALAASGVVRETLEMEPYEASRALQDGRVDLALVPTLDVLRAPQRVEVAPGIGLVGEADPSLALLVGSPLDQIRTVAFDPRYAQEALLAQLVLKEHYDAQPTFALAAPGASPSALLEGHDAALVPWDAPSPEGAVRLDLGQEWLDLTLRPLVWGLVAARPGTLDARAAVRLGEAVAHAPAGEALERDGVRVFSLALGGYAQDGLDEFASHLFYAGTLSDIPALPFVVIPTGDEGPADEPDGEDEPGGDGALGAFPAPE